jgi:formamidopyrimidine-DNA glycosylase
MPELPEVETIRNQLQAKIVGKKIKTIDIRLAKMIVGSSSKKFSQLVRGSRIKSINRRAKILIINLFNNYSLLIHLKLSGQIIFKKLLKQGIIKTLKHTHLIYYFSDGSVLLHNDVRQFGWVKLFETSKLEEYFQKEKLGPEPLDKTFSLKSFQKLLLAKPRHIIKPLLMDQKFIAGVGNIYAQESCFCAKVLPTRIVKTLRKEEIKNLYYCLIKILKKAIACHGSSIDDYLDAGGEKGSYVCHLKVYDRLNKKCARCSGIIEKMVLAGRGTYYCSKCQK